MIDWRFAAVFSLLLGTLALSGLSERRQADSLSRPLEAIPTQLGQWQATSHETLGAEVLNVLKPTSYLSRVYKGDDDSLGLFIAFYDRQTAGSTLHAPQNCLPAGGWEVWQQGSYTIRQASGALTINRYSIRRTDDKLVVYYWYQSKERIVASEVAGKFYLVRDALFSGHTATALVRLTLPDSPTSDQEAEDFATRVIPEVQAGFGR
jgi:EpsI family protein